jgi:hypothetical protein
MFDEHEEEREVRNPDFFERLTPQDQISYLRLRDQLSRTELRYNRNRRLDTLQSIIADIRQFCIRGDLSDGLRSAVAGIAWLSFDDLAINTRQLRLLIAKSKSSINGAIAKLNYTTLPAKDEEIERLAVAMPVLRGNPKEIRQWTIRRPPPPVPPEAPPPLEEPIWGQRDWEIADNTGDMKWETGEADIWDISSNGYIGFAL